MPELLKYTIKDIDFFYTDEIKKDFELDNEMYFDYLISTISTNFLERESKYKELIDLYSKKNNLSRKAILAAHGDSIISKWYYTDGIYVSQVQNWINQMDGKYGVLILYCCNPGSHEIYSKKSPVLANNSTYSELRQDLGDGKVELYIPKIGYIDSYTMDSELKQMKKSILKTNNQFLY